MIASHDVFPFRQQCTLYVRSVRIMHAYARVCVVYVHAMSDVSACGESVFFFLHRAEP